VHSETTADRADQTTGAVERLRRQTCRSVMLLDTQDAKHAIGPTASSLVSSVVLHSALVGWMFFGPSLGGRPPEPARNVYQQLIEPNEKKLVWYSFRDKLPRVSPLERHGMSRPPRTDRKT